MSSNIKVSSTIKLNESLLDTLTMQQYDSLAMTADATLTELRDRQAMPFDTGNLQNDSTSVEDANKSKGRVSIVSTAPYARKLYFHPEYNFRRNNNSAAGGRWFDSFFKDNFIVNAYKNIFGRYL